MEVSALSQRESAERTAAPCGADDLFPETTARLRETPIKTSWDVTGRPCGERAASRTAATASQPASCPEKLRGVVRGRGFNINIKLDDARPCGSVLLITCAQN